MKPTIPFAVPFLACALILAGGCNAPSKSAIVKANGSAQPGAPAVPPEIQAVAEKSLGPDVRVIVLGDLARNGRRQAIALNPLPPLADNAASGVALRRAAVLEQEGTNWTEVLRCDEYLKNPSRFLLGAPRTPTTGWRLRLGKNNEKTDQELYFTPLQALGEVHPVTIEVGWNPSVKRYQSFDDKQQAFLGEMPLLEIPASELR